VSDVLQFKPPGPQSGDRLRVLVRRGPDGKPVVDTHLTDSRRPQSEAPTSHVEGEMRLMREIVRLTIEAERLANDRHPDEFPAAITRLSQAVELLLALVVTRMP
jgi:hypothetical protein